VKSSDDTQELPAHRRVSAEERLRLSKYDPERLTQAEQQLYVEYYRLLMSSDDAVVVIHPQKLSVYLRLVGWVIAGIAGLMLLGVFVAIFSNVTAGVTTSTSSTIPAGASNSAVSLGTVFPHPPTIAGSAVTTAATSDRIGAGNIAAGNLIVLLVILAAVAAIGYWLYLRLIVRNHYITITKKLININNALLQRDPQTLPIDRFSDGRYVQPYLSYLLSRGNRNLAWSWGNRFEIDTPGAQRNIRLDNVPQPRVVMALITQLFRNTVTPTFQGLKRQIALAQAQYALAADNSGVEPDPDLMEPWPAPPALPTTARPPGET
jgi:hypothetical protein